MSNHQSRKRSKKERCNACHRGRCDECVDVLRAALGQSPRCPCDRKGHEGEPHGAPSHVCNDVCEMAHREPPAEDEGILTREDQQKIRDLLASGDAQ